MAEKGAFRAYIDLSLAMIIVGSSVVAGKLMVLDLPIFLASGLRFAFACAILVPVLILREGLPRLSMRSISIFVIQAVCGTFLFNVLLLQGLKSTGAASAGIITSTTPACMGVISFVFLKEKLQSRTVIGIALSMAGVMAINLVGLDDAHGAPVSDLAGNLLVFGAVVAESLFLLLRKTVPEDISTLGTATLMSVFGFLLFLPFGLYQAQGFDFGSVSSSSWLVVAYYGVFITVLAYIFWFRGVVRVSAGTAGVFTGIMPVSALVLSALVLGEPLTLAHISGCALVLGGIWLICRK